jgi:hypothetical protein
MTSPGEATAAVERNTTARTINAKAKPDQDPAARNRQQIVVGNEIHRIVVARVRQ